LQDKDQEWEAYEEDGVFYVKGRAVDRLMGRINIEDNESMYYFQKCLKNMGIEEKLKELGICSVYVDMPDVPRAFSHSCGASARTSSMVLPHVSRRLSA
jgi:Obg family GTPase CgtA-like protein